MTDSGPVSLPTPTSRARRAIGLAYSLALASGTPMTLDKFAGVGNWSVFSDDERDRAGRDALAQIDRQIGDLREVRDLLAQALSNERAPQTANSASRTTR